MNRLNVAILGSNGFIAGHLINKLRANNSVNLFLFGRSSSSRFGSEFPYKQIKFDHAEALKDDFASIDVIYHLVSETIPSSSWSDPMIEIEKNLIPFTKFLNAVSQLDVKKMAFVSSAGTVYGATTGKVKEDSDKKPFSPYGIIKLAMENLLSYYETRFGLRSDIYRVSNVYGEGQDTGKGLGIINTFLEKITRENSVTIFGDGEATRNYIYAEDVASLLLYSLNDHAASGIYNISSDATLTINQLIEIIKGMVEEKFIINKVESRKSDNTFIDLDNTRIISAMPDFRFTPIKKGIEKTYSAIKSQKVKN